MAQSETVERILRTATVLFAERGFAETSLRTITSMAEVNLAAVNYHFGSKKALIQAVFTRFLEPFCMALEKNLDELESDKVNLQSILLTASEAFISTQLKVGDKPDRFARLMTLAYTQSQDHLRRYCSERYGKTLNRFSELLNTAAPGVDVMSFYWRINFMLGASLFTLSSFESIIVVVGENPEEHSVDEMFKHLVPAMTGMFQSEAPQHI